MELRNCVRCGKLFAGNDASLCPDCVKEDEDLLRKIRDYLGNHPNASMMELVEQTGVPVEKVMSFLRAERLILRTGGGAGQAAMTLTCRSCGTPISSGRFCKNCADALARKLDGAARSPGVRRQGEMHTWKK